MRLTFSLTRCRLCGRQFRYVSEGTAAAWRPSKAMRDHYLVHNPIYQAEIQAELQSGIPILPYGLFALPRCSYDLFECQVSQEGAKE